MELVEGETLRGRIAGGPLPMAAALDVAVALADALAAVHAKGITHRNLKPENIILTADGRIKMLDFGLARWQPQPDADHDLTVPSDATQVGVMMGTVGYMSPEQVRGERVESTSDIFSLGCVIYEMLTARRAFEGTTPADTLAAILKEEPPLDGLPSMSGASSAAVCGGFHASDSSRHAISRSICGDSRARPRPTRSRATRSPSCRSPTPADLTPSI